MKNFFLVIAGVFAAMQVAFAVDINKASQAELEAAKGIGPAKAKIIIDERNKNGAFKSWDDVDARVKGVGEKTADNMKASGLTIGGAGGAYGAAEKAEAKKEAKEAKVTKEVKEPKEVKKEAKETKEAKKEAKEAEKEKKKEDKKKDKEEKKEKESKKDDAKK